MYGELALFLASGQCLRRSVQGRSLGPDKADTVLILMETLAAHTEAMFLDLTMTVWAGISRKRAAATFSQMSPGHR